MSDVWKIYPGVTFHGDREQWVIDERVDGCLTRSSGGRSWNDAVEFATQRADQQRLGVIDAWVDGSGVICLEVVPKDLREAASVQR